MAQGSMRVVLAALAGIAIAALGVVASAFLHVAWADGAASVVIGLILCCIALILANETRSLIAGEAVAPVVMERMREAVCGAADIRRLDDVTTLHLGPSAILVALTVSFDPGASVKSVAEAIADVTQALKSADERVSFVYVRPAQDG